MTVEIIVRDCGRWWYLFESCKTSKAFFYSFRTLNGFPNPNQSESQINFGPIDSTTLLDCQAHFHDITDSISINLCILSVGVISTAHTWVWCQHYTYDTINTVILNLPAVYAMYHIIPYHSKVIMHRSSVFNIYFDDVINAFFMIIIYDNYGKFLLIYLTVFYSYFWNVFPQKFKKIDEK